MLHAAGVDVIAAALIILGVLLLAWPRGFRSNVARERKERLEQLRTGAPERHFEERRELETYRWVGGPAASRLLGAALLLAGLVVAFAA